MDQNGKVGVSLKKFKWVGWVFVQKWFIGIMGSPKNFVAILKKLFELVLVQQKHSKV